ncbi:MAG: alpha-amylase family glycosyl hydrolase, partial [Raoultibacter sp.]
MQKDGSRIRETLAELYSGETLQRACNLIKQELYAWRTQAEGTRPLTEKDAMLITYGDAITRDGEKPLQTLRTFLNEHLDGEITNVHLLPIFPYTSDDGFSVADYQTVDPALGSWEDVTALGQDFGVMLDAVVNHTSQSHEWFQRCMRCETPYRDYYIACDPNADYTSVIRPRTLPLLTAFQTAEGQKHYWTTFSEDQVDVNYSSPELLREIIHVLLTYASYGARFIRLDAIGFAWKQQGTGCMSLPKTHTLVRLMRQALEITYPDTKISTETNVPHEENISYFGEGNEAHLVYQFPLPPLTMFTLLTQNAERLTSWAAGLAKTPLKPD